MRENAHQSDPFRAPVTTVAILAALVVVWLAFGLLTSLVRRHKLRGEHPGVGEATVEQIRPNERTPRQSWKDGRRPWH